MGCSGEVVIGCTSTGSWIGGLPHRKRGDESVVECTTVVAHNDVNRQCGHRPILADRALGMWSEKNVQRAGGRAIVAKRVSVYHVGG